MKVHTGFVLKTDNFKIYQLIDLKVDLKVALKFQRYTEDRHTIRI